MSNKGIQGRDNVTIKIYIYSMNKNVLIIVVVVVIIVLGIGWYFMQTPAVVQQENETETPSEVIVNLSEQNGSGLNFAISSSLIARIGSDPGCLHLWISVLPGIYSIARQVSNPDVVQVNGLLIILFLVL